MATYTRHRMRRAQNRETMMNRRKRWFRSSSERLHALSDWKLRRKVRVVVKTKKGMMLWRMKIEVRSDIFSSCCFSLVLFFSSFDVNTFDIVK